MMKAGCLGLGAGMAAVAAVVGLFQSKLMKFILFITKKPFIVHQCPIQHVMSPSVFWFWPILTINLNLCAITFGICRDHIQPALYINECNMLYHVVTSYFASDPPSKKLTHRDKCSESTCRRPDSCRPWARSSLSTILNNATCLSCEYQTCIMLVCRLHWAGSVAVSVSLKSTSW